MAISSFGMKKLARAVSAGALGLAILATGTQGSARAEDEDNSASIWNLDQRLWKGFLSAMGLQSGTEVGIDYRERSPLVVPPERSLPPPQSAPPKTAAWPVDPEAKRRQEMAATRKPRSVRGYDPEVESRNLNPSEMGPRGGTPNTSSTRSSGPARTNNNDPVAPSELGYFGGLFSGWGWGQSSNRDELGTFVAEPPRTSLVAPPVGYQTPSSEQPYGNTKRIEPYKPVKPENEVR
jgi:hypothetical protein